jgi:hypothetical protein
MVLDLLIVAELFDMVEVLLMPVGLVEVVVRVVVVLGTWVVRVVVIFDELLLIVAGVVWAWAARPPVTSKAARNPKKRFMVWEEKWVKKPPPYPAENVPKCRSYIRNYISPLAMLTSRKCQKPRAIASAGLLNCQQSLFRQ